MMNQPQYYSQDPQHQAPHPMQSGGAAATAPAKRLSGLAMTTMALIGAVLAWMLLTSVAWAAISPHSEELANVMRLIFLSVEGLVTLAAAICFLALLHRSYRQLRARGASLRFSPGFAVGCWFIPIANLFLPFLVVRDAMKAKGSGTGLVAGWWLLFLVYNFVRMLAQFFSMPNAPLNVPFEYILRLRNIFTSVSAPLQIVAFGLWIVVAYKLATNRAERTPEAAR